MALAKKKKSKKGIVIGIIIAVVIIGLFAVPALMPKPSVYTDVTVTKANIETYYTFSGSVESKNSQNVMASSVLQISGIKVNEGEKVKKDTVLFTTSQGGEIKSQIAGTVSKIYVEKDQQVMAGTPLCDIYDFDNLQTTVKVDEYDLSCISIDKEVTVTINSLNKEITGTVLSVSDTATNQNGVSYFTAVIDLPKDSAIKVGMTAEARILNKKVTDVLTIPMKALKFDDNDKPYVLLKQVKGIPAQRYVKVGINDGKTVEITDGLTDGQVISYIPVSSTSTSSASGFVPPTSGR
jgi:HlyD family secretion protein